MAELLTSLNRDGIETESRGSVPMALPADDQQVQAVLRRAHVDGLRVVPLGLGSKLGWCRPGQAQEADLLLSTRRLNMVVDHVPGDGTVTAQAGCTMSQLEHQVLSGGHRLTPAVPDPKGCTLGGVLGAGLSGPDRQKRGPLRHHVLGLRVALPDGTLARSGGRLVKNVTGFDLHRLYTGSRGTLCVLLEASLRLFPRADEHTHLMREESHLAPLLEACRELRSLEVEPLAWTLENHGGPWRMHVALEGRGRAHEQDVEDVRQALHPQTLVHGSDADEAFDALRALEVRGGWGEARVLTRHSRTGAALELLAEQDDLLLSARVGLGEVRLQVPGLGDAPAADQTERLCALRDALRPLGARLEPRVVAASTHLDMAPTRVDQPALDWMFSLQEDLDPKGQFRSPCFPGRLA